MLIVLDTNIICQDYRFSTPDFKLFLNGIHLVNGKLAIPEVVVDEAVNRFKEDLESAFEGLYCAERKLSKLVDYRRLNIHLVRNLQDEMKIFKNRLLDLLSSRGGIILPYPNIEHKKVVTRDLERKKPFKRDGSGYRDTLIWENIRSAVIEYNEIVAFITNNIKDFGEGPVIDNVYHSELENPAVVRIYRSIKTFNEDLILPETKLIIELGEALRDKNGINFDIYSWISKNMLELINGHDLTRIITNMPSGSAYITIVGINNINVLDYNVSDTEHNQRYVSANVELNVQHTIKYNYEAIRFINKHISESEFNRLNEFISGVEANDDIVIYLTFIYDKNTFEILSNCILPITGKYGSIESDRSYNPELTF